MMHVASLLTMVAVASLWQGAALALLAVVMLRVAPRASAALRHTLLVALFGAATVLPWLRMQTTTAAHGYRVAPWVGAAIAALWMVAAAARALQLFLAWRHLRAVRRQALPIANQSFAAGSRQAVLCSSSDVDSPVILGFWSPRLLLPEWMVPSLSPEELQQIALHECEHLRRGDDWMNLLLQIGLVVSPLNPALLWMNRKIGVQRELAVDAAVVAQTAEPLAYAACLTRLAEQRMQRTGLRLALAAWERKSELVQRVHALLREPKLWGKRQSALAAAAAGVVLLTASTGIARVPQFVRIAEPPVTIAAAQTPAVPAMDLRGVRFQSNTAMHMVATSYEVKPAATMKPKAQRKHKSAVVRKTAVCTQTLQADETAPTIETQPRAVQTLATVSPAVVSPATKPVKTDAGVQQNAPARMITSDFVSPYVAVPTANGWLLIEL